MAFSSTPHGGTEPIQTYTPGGTLAGCWVDASGDVAITATSPGGVTVYAKGNPNRAVTYSNFQPRNPGVDGL